MKKKKLFAIIMSMLMIACFMPTMAFAENDSTIFTDTNDGNTVHLRYRVLDAEQKTVEVIHSADYTKGSNVPYSTYSGTVTIPVRVTHDDVTYSVIGIDNSAFYGSMIAGITLNEGLQYIDYSAFRNCSKLESIQIPASVTRIGGPAKASVFGGNTEKISSGSVTKGAAKIRSITFAENSQLTEIGSGAFAECGNIATLAIPAGVTTIGESAFANCYGLETVQIPAGVTEGIVDALDGWANAGKVTFASGSPYSNESGILYNNSTSTLLKALDTSITSVAVKEGTKAIGDYAFYGCDRLSSVTLPNGLLTIGDRAFEVCCSENESGEYCGLKSITLPDTVTSIGADAFYDCAALEKVKLSDSLTRIGERAFSGAAFKTVIVPKNVTAIPEEAFATVGPVKTVILCGDVTSVEKNAFCGMGVEEKSTPVMTSETAPTFSKKAFGAEYDKCGKETDKEISPTALTVLVPSTAKSAYEKALSQFNKNENSITINTFGPSITDLTVKATEGSKTATIAAEVPEGGTLTVESANDSIATAVVDDNNKITITGEEAGKTTITTTIKLTDPACTLTNTINVTVLAGDKEPAVVVSADTEAKVNEKIDDAVKETAKNIANALQPSASAEGSAQSEGLTVEKTVLNSAAHEVLEENTISAAAGETALEEAGVSVSNTDAVSIVVQPYLNVTVTDVKQTGDAGAKTTTLTLDITPMFKKVATTANVANNPNAKIVLDEADGETKNAVELKDQGGKLTVTAPTEVRVPLPEDLLTDDKDAYIIHTKDDGKSYVYTGSVKNNVLTFTSEHGFSTFTISQENPTAAKIGDTSYPTLQDALNDAKSNETIELMKDNLSGNLTTTKTVALKNGTETDGEITVTVNGKAYKIAKDGTQEVSYTKISGGRGGYVAPTTDDTKKDDTATDTKTDEQIQAENAAKAASLTKALTLKARSVKTAKGNIKVTLTVDNDAIKAIEDLGYTVKYKFYRSTKKAASYKAALEKTGKTYTNTSGKKGTKYYYKARVMVYDAQGELIAMSALTQCKYACRTK